MTGTVIVAVAGGAGAAIGASLGQFVQWWREHRQNAIEDQRRSQDRNDLLARERRDCQRDAYVAMIGHVAKIQRSTEDIARESYQHLFRVGDGLEPFGSSRVISSAFDEISAASAASIELANAYASPDLIAAIAWLGSHRLNLRGAREQAGGRNPRGELFFSTFYERRDDGSVVASMVAIRDYSNDRARRAFGKRSEATAGLISNVASWCLRQARYELSVDAEPPQPLSFDVGCRASRANTGAGRSAAERDAVVAEPLANSP